MAAVTAIQASAALAASAGARPPKGLPGPVHPLPAPPGVRSPRSAGHPSSAVAGPQPAAPNVTGSAAMRADAQALAQARATGKPVAVPSLTSQTREVLAQPNGQFELVSNTMPVRVQAGGAWQPVSTTLRPGASGAWSVPLTAAPVTFSGGGSGPLVTVTDSLTGKSASVTFPFPLPRPVVTGSTALYKNVFPGTDLRLQATSTGYTEVLIVRNAAAASDLRLRSLTFTLRGGPGMSVRPGPHGSTAVVDAASGKQVFASGQPVMWDSVPAPSPAAAARAGAGGSGASMPVPVPVRRVLGVGGSPAQAALTLTPVTTSLAGRPVRYPLYIDPQVNETTAQYYSEVNDRGDVWNTTTGTTSQPSGVVQSGYCGYDQNAQFPCYWGQPPTLFFTSRVYFMVDTSVLAPLNGFRPNVYSASFAPHEVYNSASCASEPVAVWSTSTANISSSTSWPGPQGSQLGTASSNAGGGSGCSAAADVPVDITSVIQAHVQNADAPPAMAFEVRAPDESNKLQFKKFSKNPTFTVWFNYAPLQPTSLAASDAVTCTSTTYTSDNPPTLSARGVDNNPSPEDLYHTISLYDSAGNLVSTPNNGMAHNGGRHSGDPNSTNIRGQWTPGTLSNGATYHFTDQTQQLLPAGDQASARSSPVSAAYDFTVLSVPPASPPTISTVDYPVDPNGQAYWGQPQGAPAVFTVGTNGASHVAGFAYSFDGGTNSEPVPTTTDCSYLNNGGLGTAQGTGGFGITNGERALIRGSTAQIQVPASLPNGRHTLRVKSFDLAHNASAEATYTFYVTPNYQGQSTRMFTPDTPSTPTSLWSSRSGPNASLLAEQNLCCGMTTWPGGNQIRFDATTAGQSFSVSVNVPSNGTWQLGTDMTTAPDYGQVRLDLDGANLGGTAATPFDGYTASVSSVYLDLGTQTLTAGAHTLTVTVTGQNASSAGFKAGLIYLTLSPPNRYEADTLSYGSATAGTLQPQCFSQPTWADNCQLFLSNTAQGTSFQLNFAAPVESDYALGLNITTASDYGTLKFELDTGKDDYLLLDNTAAHPIDAYSSTVKAQYVFLGGIHLTSGTHSLKVTVVGTNASSTGNRYNAGINYLAAAPVTGAKMDSFTHAMNNLGIASDFGSGSGSGFVMNFDLVNSATGNNLSLQALQDAGITVGTATSTGNTFSLGGATFTMPQLRTDSAGGPVVDDNVVPDGQTIAVSPPGKATGVALLATSTCGPSPAASATLNYAGAQSANPGIPSVPEWGTGATNVAIMQLGHHDNGTTPNTDERPRLYEVILPANPNALVTSVTLPVMPVNYLTDSQSCTTSANLLHILAIGFRTQAQPSAGGAWTGAYDAPMDTAVLQSPAVTNRTYRVSVPLTSQGSGPAPTVRIHLSNAYSDTPLALDAVTVAAQSTASGGFATAAAPVTVSFGGQSCVSTSAACVTIPAGGDAYSDEFTLPSMTGSSGRLTVSLHVPASASVQFVPVHQLVNSITTAWASGDVTGNSDGTPFSNVNSSQGEFFLSGVDVSDPTATDGTVAVLGDQAAVAAPSFTTGTWPAGLPPAFAGNGITVPGSVVNASTSDAPPEDWWRMTGQGLETATTAFDSGTRATNSLTLSGGAHWTPPDSNGIVDNPGTGVSPGSLSLSGSGQSAQSAGPVITSTSSFAVSAWVKLSTLPTRNAAVAAQDGASDSGFYLGYSYAHSGDWAFYFANSDVTSPAFTGAYGPAAAANTWTLLTGIYNASTGTIQLYVNGTLAASTTYTPSWSAGGAFTVGRSKYNGSPADYLPGEVSDVRAYSRVAIGARIAVDTGMSSVTSGNAGTPFWNSAFEDAAAGEPNLRDVIISLGANDVLQGTGETTIEGNLRALVSDIQGRYQYTPGQQAVPVQVFITTIPPLGLAATDARETVRQDVNQWLTGFGTPATDVFDIAGAVASSSSPNLTDPGYLSGGVPTAAYYSAIATEVPTAMTNAFPVPDTF